MSNNTQNFEIRLLNAVKKTLISVANSIFAYLVISLNLVLARSRWGLKNCQIGEEWILDDYS
jgi:hypothetical protein